MVLKYPNHDDFHRYRRALNEAYLANEAFWSREYDPEAFRWLDCAHPELDACAICATAMTARCWRHSTLATRSWLTTR